ncbi:J domain-containing protein [Sphingomonas morindae]|uniref:J domain-containing protein n=1 Tax=Sphingomonas morindae TaxID=1541170 RepID=A0ABY4X4H4_9SPHN|nr:J domain-containing protein [Sphingomonas morindae]USI71797.1 J domain-containing protein [Sphingomonas morindae]
MKLIVVLALLAAIWWLAQRRQKPALSHAEARALLAVRADASAEEIVAAHRRLIARVHPDAGGSAALAARVNAARDLLLARR